MQKTLEASVSFEGQGLHTGRKVKLNVHPTEPDTGILFSRVDLDPHLKVKASVENVRSDELRQTTLVVGEGIVRTIEHLMATFHGLGIDNALVEVDGDELPAMDGSAKDFTESFLRTGLTEQNAERKWIEVKEPIFVDHGDQSLLILPAPHLMISYTLSYRHEDLKDQFMSIPVLPEIFERDRKSTRLNSSH